MATEKGTVLSIERVQVSRKDKGLPDAHRVDLIVLPDNKNVPCRFQVRKDKVRLLNDIEVKDFIVVDFTMEMNEVNRGGKIRRFDNNILENLEKVS